MPNNKFKTHFSSVSSKEVVIESNQKGNNVRLVVEDKNIRFKNLQTGEILFSIDSHNRDVLLNKIKFTDGTSLDSASSLADIDIEAAQVFLLKTNKIFFKYDTDDNPVANQEIEFTFYTANIIDATPTISINPSDKGISLSQGGDSYILTAAEFDKAQADNITISVTIAGITDSVTIYKVQDGKTALQGGLTNPVTVLQGDSNGDVTNIADLLALEGGTFVVFKDGQEITGNSRLQYSVESSTLTEGLTASIGQSGIYSISSFDTDEERHPVCDQTLHGV